MIAEQTKAHRPSTAATSVSGNCDLGVCVEVYMQVHKARVIMCRSLQSAGTWQAAPAWTHMALSTACFARQATALRRMLAAGSHLLLLCYALQVTTSR